MKVQGACGLRVFRPMVFVQHGHAHTEIGPGQTHTHRQSQTSSHPSRGKADMAKGSFYANPLWDDPAEGNEEVRKKRLGTAWHAELVACARGLVGQSLKNAFGFGFPTWFT